MVCPTNSRQLPTKGVRAQDGKDEAAKLEWRSHPWSTYGGDHDGHDVAGSLQCRFGEPSPSQRSGSDGTGGLVSLLHTICVVWDEALNEAAPQVYLPSDGLSVDVKSPRCVLRLLLYSPLPNLPHDNAGTA